MKTELITVAEVDSCKEVILRAGEIIRQGGLVAFPTETVYGLGGDALNPESAQRIYAAKGRPSDNPLIIHINQWEKIYPIVKAVPESAKKIADAFWPGPLTMILEKSDMVPLATTGGLPSVAIRMPNHSLALAFIEAAGGYVAAPSANLSGRPSPTLAKYVKEDLGGKIEMILDGGQVGIGLESTIVDLTSATPIILRPGYVTKSMLEEVLGEVTYDNTLFSDEEKEAPKAPGMKYRHYAPKGLLTIIAGDMEKVISYINKEALQQEGKGERVGIIGTSNTKNFYRAASVKSAGNRADENSIAKELYRILREFDDEGITVIYSEAFDTDGIGQAIMNRLLKAAGHRKITV